MGIASRSLQDDIIRELARNGCGPQYAQEARKRDGGGTGRSPVWQDEESESFAAAAAIRCRLAFRHLPHAVRAAVRRLLLPGQLLDAAQPLPARCRAVPVAMRGTGRALLSPEPRRRRRADGVGEHTAALHSLKSAWRYRKEFVQGCSCKASRVCAADAGPGGCAARSPRRRFHRADSGGGGWPSSDPPALISGVTSQNF